MIQKSKGLEIMGKGGKKLNPIPTVGIGIAMADIGKAAGENAR